MVRFSIGVVLLEDSKARCMLPLNTTVYQVCACTSLFERLSKWLKEMFIMILAKEFASFDEKVAS
jgi:hypothetical protein